MSYSSLWCLAGFSAARGSSSVSVCWAVEMIQTLPSPSRFRFFANPSRFRIRLSREAMYWPTSSTMPEGVLQGPPAVSSPSSRTGPATTAATRSTRRRSNESSDGARSTLSRQASARRSVGTSATRRGRTRSSAAAQRVEAGTRRRFPSPVSRRFDPDASRESNRRLEVRASRRGGVPARSDRDAWSPALFRGRGSPLAKAA